MMDDAATTLPVLPKAEDLNREVAPVVQLANEIIIDSAAMYQEASDELKTIKAKHNALEDRRKAITQPIDAAKKSVMDLFRGPLVALEEAERIFKKKMITWDEGERRKAEEAAKIAAEAARRERERLEGEARAAEASGDSGVAAAILGAAEAITAAEPTVRAPARPAGIATTTRWSAQVENKVTFIQHCLTEEGAQYLDCIEIDMRPLNQMAVALKDRMKVPGIKAISTTGMAVRS